MTEANPPRLVVRGINGGSTLALCTEDGQVLGDQSVCEVQNGSMVSTVTVTFHVDGEKVRFA